MFTTRTRPITNNFTASITFFLIFKTNFFVYKFHPNQLFNIIINICKRYTRKHKTFKFASFTRCQRIPYDVR